VFYAFLAAVAVAVLYGLALLILPRSEQIAPAARDVAPWALGDTPLKAQDVLEVRLPVALRGYRFGETDLLLDRLTEELRLRDEEIARLKGFELPMSDPVAPSSQPPNSYQSPAGQPDSGLPVYLPPDDHIPPAYIPQSSYDPSAYGPALSEPSPELPPAYGE
jgi:hypothetical protein